MNYGIGYEYPSLSNASIQLTDRAVDGKEVFGYFQEAKGHLKGILGDRIVELRESIARVHSIREKDLILSPPMEEEADPNSEGTSYVSLGAVSGRHINGSLPIEGGEE